MNKPSNWLWLVVVLLLVGMGYYLISTVQQSTRAALAPIQAANSALSTQVADLLHPTPTIIPDPVTIIQEVRALARLETIQFTVEKVITANNGQDSFSFLFGDQLLLVAHGTVTAGIDLAKINPEDMRLQGGVLVVRLPQAEIFSAALDNDQTYVYTRETGLLSRQTIDLETLARQAAESEILNAAITDGILPLAQQNAQVFLEKFFEALGYPNALFENP